MFGLFKKQKGAEEEFRVFKTEAAKYRGIINEIKVRYEKGNLTYILYYFKDSGEEIKKLLEVSGIPFLLNERSLDSEKMVRVWNVENFISENIDPGVAELYITEFYPLRSGNKALVSSVESQLKLIFYASLDNDFFKGLGMERIVGLMDQLGVNDNDFMEHPMISKSIINAQNQAEKNITSEKPAESLEEWVKNNF